MAKTNKVSEMKNQTVRLDDRYLEYVSLKGRGKSFNQSLREMCEIMFAIESQGLMDVRGYFETNEWLYMANVLKVSDMIADKNVLSMRLSDIKAMNSYALLYDVDVKKLVAKVANLNANNVFAIVERINNYWLSDDIELKEWCKF